MSDRVHVYSMAVCPFAQRARVALTWKGVPFDLTEIDITKPRPDWFLALNPLGRVPVLRHRGRVLPESAVILAYLDDAFPEPALFPRDPYRKALVRLLADLCDQRFVGPMYRLLMNQDPDRRAALHEEALASWREVDAFLRRHAEGDTWLFDDEGFGAAEALFAPFFVRYVLNEHFEGFALPDDETYARVRRWRDACVAEPVVRETVTSDEALIKLYADYARGHGNGAVPEGAERSSFDLDWPLEERPLPPPKWA